MLCDARQSRLLIIDVQERLLGAMPDKPRAQVLGNTAILLQAAQRLAVPVIRSEQYPRGLGATDSHIEGRLTDETLKVEKTVFSCCGVAEVAELSHQQVLPQWILAGIESHVCVLQTALQLKAAGQQVFVVSDACCSRQKHHHQNALQRLSQAGVIISNTESVLFEWLRDSRHPAFKDLSKLIR
ncbi:MAG: isochorismatase family protein [Gammaproteobacteria bacterium]